MYSTEEADYSICGPTGLSLFLGSSPEFTGREQLIPRRKSGVDPYQN